MRRITVSISAAVAAMVLVSCSKPTVHARGTSVIPSGPAGAARPTGNPALPNDIGRGDARSPQGLGLARCKVSGIPRGYVAVDYIQSRDCMRSSSDSNLVFNAAILTDIRSLPVGAVMLMCADQSTPRGWFRQNTNSEARQCPRDPKDKSSAPTVVEIVKHSSDN